MIATKDDLRQHEAGDTIRIEYRTERRNEDRSRAFDVQEAFDDGPNPRLVLNDRDYIGPYGKLKRRSTKTYQLDATRGKVTDIKRVTADSTVN
jgi:hypothetical protein